MIDVAIAPAERRRRKLKRAGLIGGLVLLVALAAFFILELAPAGPNVSKTNLWVATVKQGAFSITVSAPGILVPRKIRVVTAGAPGTVKTIHVEAGDRVSAGTVLAVLSNPDLRDQVIEARARLAHAQASLVSLEATLDDHLLTLEDTLSQLESKAEVARLHARAEKGLLAQKVVGSLQYLRSQLAARSLARQVTLMHERIADFRNNQAAQIHADQAGIDALEAAYQNKVQERASLEVRAGLTGVVQHVSIQEGQRVILGEAIAKIAGMHALKARLEVPASEAAEVALGQIVDLTLDTGSGRHLEAAVTRISPAVHGGTVRVDAEPRGTLPSDARPNLAINGLIRITTLPDALYVERPVYSTPDKTMTLYRLTPGGHHAVPVTVRFGRASSNTIQILAGLTVGEHVIVSDTTGFAGATRIRIRG